MSSQMKQQEIMLGPSTSATEVKISEEKDLSCLTNSDAQDVVSAGPLNVVLLLIALLKSRFNIFNKDLIFKNRC